MKLRHTNERKLRIDRYMFRTFTIALSVLFSNTVKWNQVCEILNDEPEDSIEYNINDR